MKKLILISLIFTQVILAAEKYEDDRHVINWNDKRSLNYLFLQQCDDSYFPSLRLIIPGRLNKEYTIKIDYEDCKIDKGMTHLSGGIATEFIFEGGCVGTIEVQKKSSPLKAIIEMHDAC